MDLKNLNKGRRPKPLGMVIHGQHGVGKTTFASQAPDPVFILTEDGLGNLDTTAFPLAKNYKEVIDAIAALYKEDHKFKTVIIDSLDWLEDLVWKHVAAENGNTNIEQLGYGKGYVFAADRFREILQGLDALRASKSMGVILTAHCQIKRFDDPMSEPYDRYTLKLNSKAAAVVQEWADIVAFAAQKMVIKQEDVGFQKKVARSITTGGHVMHLRHSPAFDAKNRFSLPDTVPFNWSSFADAMAKSQTKKKTGEDHGKA